MVSTFVLGEQRPKNHIKLNPAKGVPVLITDEGNKITQSMSHPRLPEQAYPTPCLHPRDLLTRNEEYGKYLTHCCDMHPVNLICEFLVFERKTTDVSEEQKNSVVIST